MEPERRRRLAEEALAGYVSGPAAATEATTLALARVDSARAVLLVEGISDQIAVETLAARQGRTLDDERVVVLPVGGAQAVGRYLARFGPQGDGRAVAGLCDVAEERIFRRALRDAGIGSPADRAEMEALGFYVCVKDLEDELIRAAGPPEIETLFDSQGDLGSFRTMQNQPAWRDRPVAAQMRRFLGSGARRKLRYARLLVETIDLHRMPRPLVAVLASV